MKEIFKVRKYKRYREEGANAYAYFRGDDWKYKIYSQTYITVEDYVSDDTERTDNTDYYRITVDGEWNVTVSVYRKSAKAADKERYERIEMKLADFVVLLRKSIADARKYVRNRNEEREREVIVQEYKLPYRTIRFDENGDKYLCLLYKMKMNDEKVCYCIYPSLAGEYFEFLETDKGFFARIKEARNCKIICDRKKESAGWEKNFEILTRNFHSLLEREEAYYAETLEQDVSGMIDRRGNI